MFTKLAFLKLKKFNMIINGFSNKISETKILIKHMQNTIFLHNL